MLLVGPGTGLSPLIGFLQYRELQLGQLRAARLLESTAANNGNGQESAISPETTAALENGNAPANADGFKNSESSAGGDNPAMSSDPAILVGTTRLYFGCRNLNDYLYQQELEAWRDAGVLTHLEVAFSRLGEQKSYVQHLIGQKGRDIWQTLSQPNCHYFVCGDAKMADDVFETLMTIAKTEGGLSHAQAVEFFLQMQAENRYITDVWGVLLNFQKAMADVQEAKYTQGERWLKRVTAGV